MPLDQEIHNFTKEGDISNSSSEAEAHGSVCKDESLMAGISQNTLSNLGDSNRSGEITEITLKIESMELDRADIENSSSNHSLVLDDTSSCSEREADSVLVTEDEEEEDLSLTSDHYTNHISGFTSEKTMTNEENFQNQRIDDIAGNLSGSVDDSLVESDDKNWMLGLSSSTSSIEEKTTRFIQNGYLDTVDGMFNLLKPIL